MPTATTRTQYCIKDSKQDNNEGVGKETKMLHCLKSLKELSSAPLTVKDSWQLDYTKKLLKRTSEFGKTFVRSFLGNSPREIYMAILS